MYEMTDTEKLQLIEDKRAELARLLWLATGVEVSVDCNIHSSYQDTRALADAAAALDWKKGETANCVDFCVTSPLGAGTSCVYCPKDIDAQAKYAHLHSNPLREDVSPLRRLAALARLGQLWSEGV